jgi:hypothetical protein
MSLLVDYTLPVEEVFIQAAKLSIDSSRNLDVLTHKEPEVALNLPSWVPDFSIPTDSGRINRQGCFNASMGLGKPTFRHLAQNRLQVSAVRVAVVRDTLEFEFSRIHETAAFLQSLPETSMIHCPQPREIHYPAVSHKDDELRQKEKFSLLEKQTRFEVLWRTLSLDIFNAVHPAPSECGKATLEILQLEVRKRQLTFAFNLLNEDEMPALRERAVHSTTPESVNEFLELGEVRRQVGLSYSALRSILGYGGGPDGKDTEFPPEILHLERQRSKSAKETFDSGYARDFFDEKRSINLSNDAKKVIESVTQTLMYRSLFIDCNGELGLGPSSIEIRDEVWILAGVSVPFILRPEGEGQFRLISEAYVHGIMHGEAIAKLEKPGAMKIILV